MTFAIRDVKFYEAGRKPGRRGRVYDVDDIDFEEYKQKGGTMSRAEFFNHHLGLTDAIKPGYLERRLCDSLGAKPEPAGNLENRIRLKMSG